MDPAYDPIEAGLQIVGENHRDAVLQDINLCVEPWTAALRALRGYPDVVSILEAVHPQVIPHLIKGYQQSPVHHIPYVVAFMARITTAEVEIGSLTPRDVKCGVIAALFHDIGIGDSVLPKITEEMIKVAPDADRPQLRRDGIASRREHMEKGEDISRVILETFRQEQPFLLSAEDVAVILDIVGTHDNSKMPLMEETVDRRWLLSHGKEDWLKHCHWEADALWMLSLAGILVDLKRQNEDDTPTNRKKKFYFNFSLHAEIVKLYAEAFGGDFRYFAFKHNYLYRSDVGFQMAMDFKQQIDLLPDV